MRRMLVGVAPALVLAGLPLIDPALATTGDGCWKVANVHSWDVLNIRSERSARAPIVYRLHPDEPAIILGGLDARDAEARCLPRSRLLQSRWCPVSIYSGDGERHGGFAKRRYLEPVECP